jgi:RNA polymerase sigma factor (sigma-70 family)
MTESDWLAEGFEKNRTRLRAVAYRMLGSLAEADDAVQEAWLHANRSDASAADSLGAWLTTIVARVCLNVLRSRRTRREEPMGVHVPDPIISRGDGTSPEDEALLADAVGLALQVVLETLTPAERLAFVLHDMFDLPFDEIAPWWGVPRPRRESSPAGPGAGCEEPMSKLPTAISVVSGKWSTPSSPLRAAATSTRSSRSSTQMSLSDSTGGRRVRMLPWWSTERQPLPLSRSWSPSPPHWCGQHW